jgi:type IX secretion system PorP/SprF family membrane protein
MLLKKQLIILTSFLLLAQSIKAQDIVLSQPFVSNQFFGPAGVGNGLYSSRFQGNMKEQMIDGENLYRTIVIGYDSRFKPAENTKNYLGIGGYMMSDQVMNGALKSNFIALDLAYHIFLDRNLYNDLSLGLGTVFAQTTIDKSNLKFADQYDIAGGFTGTASLENLIPYPSSFSANSGVLYTSHSDESYFQMGGTAMFLTKPNLTYALNSTAPETKYRVFINGEIPLFTDYTLAYHGNFLNRKAGNQFYAGASVGISLSNYMDEVKRIYFGCYIRNQQALVPTVSYISDKYVFGISYDIYNPNITGANLKLSSLELSMSCSFGSPKTNLFRTIFD